MVTVKSVFFVLVAAFYSSLQCEGYTYFQPIWFGEGECFDDNFNAHPIGSVWFDKEKCEQLQCVTYDDLLYIEGYGCHSIGHPDDCWLVPGSGENYPDCCPDVKCAGGKIW